MRRDRVQNTETREAEEAVLTGCPGKVHGDCDASEAVVFNVQVRLLADSVLEVGA